MFKTDQEPALVDLMKQICALRPSSRSCLTHSGVGDSKGNGLAERAVQSLEEMIRVHKLWFESHLKTKLPCAHPLMAWLVEHRADVLNRYNMSQERCMAGSCRRGGSLGSGWGRSCTRRNTW